MLTKFRRLFNRKAPLELEVHRRAEPADGTEHAEVEAPAVATLTAPEPDPGSHPAPPTADSTHEVHEAEDRLIRQIARIEPLADTMIKRLERIGATEQELSAMVEAFTRQSGTRDQAIRDIVQKMTASSDRQNQLLAALRDQLDQANTSQRELSGELRAFGSDLQEITAQQQASARNGKDLVVALREHTERFNEQMKVLAGVGVGLIILASLVLVAGVVLVLMNT